MFGQLARLATTGRVGITEIYPAGAAGLEYAPDLVEDRAEPLDILFGALLQPDLCFDAVVAQRPVRRAGYHAVNALCRQSPQDFERVAADNAVEELR